MPRDVTYRLYSKGMVVMSIEPTDWAQPARNTPQVTA